MRSARFRHEIGCRIADARGRLERIHKDWNSLGLSAISGGAAPAAETGISGGRETTSQSGDRGRFFVGRKAEKRRIIEKLLSVSSDVLLVPIVGMGGMGKTALAQEIIDDGRMKEHFKEKIIWVYLGLKFDAAKIIRAVTGEEPSPSTTLEDLHGRLRSKLDEGRFLLVLDDVWSDKHEEWEQILPPIRAAKRGGAVIFTTRSHSVAAAAAPRISSPESSLTRLPEEDCWRIFKERAFGNGNSDAVRRLEPLGRGIVKKLGGVPLAAMAVAGFLGKSFEEAIWRSTQNSMDFIVNSDILPILSLSYNHLPPRLKPCFAYCSVFPKGFVFDKSRLVQMWTAQSYAQSDGDARIFMEELHVRAFFSRNRDGSYQMHDLMHDLARSVSSKFCRLMEEDGGAPGMIRHASFSNDPEVISFERLHGFYKARSLLYLHDPSRSSFGTMPGDLFDRLRFIRVLYLAYSGIEELPESVAKLKHLRYLDLSYTQIGILPEALCHLWNLRTLRIVQPRSNMFLVELPRGMNKLINLQRLDVNEDVVANIPGIGSLSSLLELKVFRVREEDGYRISELKDLGKLEEGLCIKELQNVEIGATAAQAALHTKTRLKDLEMEWTGNWEERPRDMNLEAEVLERLKPPGNLESLRISNNAGAGFPAWMRDSSSYHLLSSISLHGCRNWASLPPLGQFSSLKELKITMMERVTQVGREFHGGEVVFPALESLELSDMKNWTRWESEMREMFPALRTLLILSCPNLEGVPQLPASLVNLTLQKVGLRALPEISSSTDRKDREAYSLKKLHIDMCPNLRSIPGRLLRHLKNTMEELEVRNCRNLASMGLDLRYLKCLKHLSVTCCPNLTPETEPPSPPSPPADGRSVPRDRLPQDLQDPSDVHSPELAQEQEPQSLPPSSSSAAPPPLQTLTTDNRSVLEHLLPQKLSSLQRLIISDPCQIPTELRDLTSLSLLSLCGFPELRSPPALQHLPRLEKLDLTDCPQLQSLPLLRGLSQLTKLVVINCPKLRSLPEGGLPAAMKMVSIRGCPALRERCKRGRGPDWSAIAHVPHLFM